MITREARHHQKNSVDSSDTSLALDANGILLARHHQKNSVGIQCKGSVGGVLLMICRSTHDQKGAEGAGSPPLNTQPIPLLWSDSNTPCRLLTINKNNGANRAPTVVKIPAFSSS